MDGVVNDSAVRVPAAALRPFVPSWTGYRQSGLPASVHRGLPSPFLTVIFTLDDPLVMAAHPDPRQQPGTFQTLVGGLHTKPALIAYDGRQSGIQLAVTPLGARALLDMRPGSWLASTSTATRCSAGTPTRSPDGCGSCPAGRSGSRSWRNGWPAGSGPPTSGPGSARKSGTPGSGCCAVAAASRWRSSRPIPAGANGTCGPGSGLRPGLGPKEAGRVIRFDRARREIQRRAAGGQSLALAELAAVTGYFDQAHLNRDFRELAGCAPTTWLADEFRNVQATLPGPLAE